jgi:hypothetical protein
VSDDLQGLSAATLLSLVLVEAYGPSRYPEGRMTPFNLTNDRLHHNVDCES